MKRRHLFQFTSAALATLGLSQLRLQRQSLRYAKALAQPTPRKLALLVGVNDYPRNNRFLNLDGCATDVEMQRQLLIHRFGFNHSDIVTLSDDSDLLPTRDNILTAFEEHLIKQATPNSVVVFHFSGHGSLVLDPDPIHNDDLNSTFVPRDALFDANDRTVDDIMGRTLFLLMSALDTEQVTAVLDSCYSGGGTRGNLRIRAAAGGQTYRASDLELAYQDQWLSRLEATHGMDRAEFLRRRELGVAKGIVIAAAERDQPAADVTFDGFAAGAFTYLMTQFLWQQTDSLQSTIARIRPDIRQLSDQRPVIDTQAEAPDAYFVPDANQQPPAEAVVTETRDGEAVVWLGGVHPDVVATYRRGSTLTASDRSPITVTGRRGLYATVGAALPATTPLREAARVIPPDLTLVVGIDSSLRPQSQDIAERINGWPRMQAAIPDAAGVYDCQIHLVLSQLTAAYRSRLPERVTRPEENSIGLLTPGLTDYLDGTFAPSSQSLQTTLNQLFPKLQVQLAARFLKVSLNASTSQLALQAVVTNLENQQPVVESVTQAVRDRTPILPHSVHVRDRLQITVTSHETGPLHLAIIAVTPSGNLVLLHPANPATEVILAPGQTVLFPNPADRNDLQPLEAGTHEALVLASRRPFTRMLKGLDAVINGSRLPDAPDPSEDLSGLNGLLEGFDAPRGEADDSAVTVLGVDAIAILSLTVEALG